MKIKGKNDVAGKATVFVFPDLNTGACWLPVLAAVLLQWEGHVLLGFGRGWAALCSSEWCWAVLNCRVVCTCGSYVAGASSSTTVESCGQLYGRTPRPGF